jgi:hypothetical protein
MRDERDHFPPGVGGVLLTPPGDTPGCHSDRSRPEIQFDDERAYVFDKGTGLLHQRRATLVPSPVDR